MRFVTEFGCLTIPEEFRGVAMGYGTPLSFCLPCERDEGVCSLALMQVRMMLLLLLCCSCCCSC